MTGSKSLYNNQSSFEKMYKTQIKTETKINLSVHM